jgi:regulator of replication initiation timing
MSESEERARSEEVKEFKEIIEQEIGEADLIQNLAKQEIEENKAVCVEMDKMKSNLEKEKIVAETLTPDIVDKIPESYWEYLRKSYFQRHIANYRGVQSLRRDMELEASQLRGYRTVANTVVSSNATSASSGYVILTNISNSYPPMKETLQKVKFEKTWLDNIEFIKQELQRIMPDALRKFESVVKGMSGTGNPELKHEALLNLRSVIFYQIFDTIAPESFYCQTSWYKLAPPGTVSKGKRFCQPKFFMLENHNESDHPQSVIDSVNKIAKELSDHFNGMSELGKKGGDVLLVDACYHETLSSMANALRLRSQLQGTLP